MKRKKLVIWISLLVIALSIAIGWPQLRFFWKSIELAQIFEDVSFSSALQAYIYGYPLVLMEQIE
jgi:hypothetical protein